MKTFFKYTGLLLLIAVIGFSIWCYTNMKDRHPGYNADLKITNTKPSGLKAGFAAIPITPEVPDRWVDKNGDAEYNTDDGDSFTDGNGNGVFDGVWMAGFSNKRAANGIHDDLWARTMIIDDGTTRIATVVLDAIGFMHDDVVDIRSRIPREAGVTYLIVTSTHTHESPDLLGLWGDSHFKNGVNPIYMEFVKNQVVKSVVTAAKGIRPVKFAISEDLINAAPFVMDTRKPEVLDPGIRIIRAIDKENGQTIGSLVAWADHPETLWSDNLQITSDFPHFVREYIEKGVYKGDSLAMPGIGGIVVYMNGAIGGLMTTHPRLPVKDPFTDEVFNEPTFGKADAQGKQLALVALKAMEKPMAELDSASISLMVKTISLPFSNTLFRLAAALGVINRGTNGWMSMRSEVSVFNIGPLAFATIPGEIYPEIINGGIEKPAGGDIDTEILEIPPVRDMMKGQFKFIFGLANDEVGYIIPKSQWDAKAPYTYDKSPYGEVNSLGPETAPLLHQHIKELLNELNQK